MPDRDLFAKVSSNRVKNFGHVFGLTLKAIKNKKATKRPHIWEILDLKFCSPNIKIVEMRCPKIGSVVIGRMIMKKMQ